MSWQELNVLLKFSKSVFNSSLPISLRESLPGVGLSRLYKGTVQWWPPWNIRPRADSNPQGSIACCLTVNQYSKYVIWIWVLLYVAFCTIMAISRQKTLTTESLLIAGWGWTNATLVWRIETQWHEKLLRTVCLTQSEVYRAYMFRRPGIHTLAINLAITSSLWYNLIGMRIYNYIYI